MPKSFWLPKDDAGKADWLTHFAAELPKHNATIGVTTGEVTATAKDADYFAYIFAAQQAYAAAAEQWTAYKNKARDGTAPAMGDLPSPPTLGDAPDTVAPGIFKRATLLVARFKKHPGYTEDIGKALQVIGAEQTEHLDTLKPDLKLQLRAGKPLIKCKRLGMDALELQVNRGDGKGFVLLDLVQTPEYTDNSPLPAPGQTALWIYKAIYRNNGERVGEWSDEVSLAVRG